MIRLDLDAAERSNLMELLESSLSDLRMEIADTDQLEFREELKVRRNVLLKGREALEREVRAAEPA